MAPPAAFPPGWASHCLVFIVETESAGFVAMHRSLCVCEWWNYREGWGNTFILLPTLSRTTIVVEAGLIPGFWERCEHQGGFSVTGFLESKVNMVSYLAMARHFPLRRAPGPGNTGFPERMSESQEKILHEALSGLISVTSNSHGC